MMKETLKKTVWGIFALGTVAMFSACSDDDEYPADIFFTGSQPTITVLGSSASAAPESAMSPAAVFTFTAASDWTVTAKDYNNPAENATWLKFFQNSGSEGGQRVGIYNDANTTGKDRAAYVEISSKGSSVSFLVIQKGAQTVNPNAAAIDPSKTVAAIEYYNGSSFVKSYNFSYTKGIVDGVTIVTGSGDDASVASYTIATDGALVDGAVSANKVVVTRAWNDSRSFAVLDGKVATGYLCSTVDFGLVGKQIDFAYNSANQLNSVKADGFAATLGWAGMNNNTEEFAFGANSGNISANYGADINDYNIDLNAFIGLEAAGLGVDYDCKALQALNLVGRRSGNLVSSVSLNGVTTNITYAAGVVDAKGNTLDGVTATLTANGKSQTVKVFFE